MKDLKVKEELLENNIVTLIEDEDYDGAGSPAIVSAVTAVTALIGITTACTRDCWHPGR
ncbi:hypothetical protein [Clostridium chrysemydis]|uniref:hypothetical protein n=1 Tax=Clostridium chrysemydis TaxID=2665504 RepID=UPI001883FE70|nr:hypothetical protein [Clostridium chrysemydis]